MKGTIMLRLRVVQVREWLVANGHTEVTYDEETLGLDLPDGSTHQTCMSRLSFPDGHMSTFSTIAHNMPALYAQVESNIKDVELCREQHVDMSEYGCPVG